MISMYVLKSVICKEKALAKMAPSESDVDVLNRSIDILFIVIVICIPLGMFIVNSGEESAGPRPGPRSTPNDVAIVGIEVEVSFQSILEFTWGL